MIVEFRDLQKKKQLNLPKFQLIRNERTTNYREATKEEIVDMKNDDIQRIVKNVIVGSLTVGYFIFAKDRGGNKRNGICNGR